MVTGTRAEYGLLKPVMEQIKLACELELNIIVTGMHLSSLFGLTVKEIIKDGFQIEAKVKMLSKNDNSDETARSIGEGIIGLSGAFKRNKPDIVIVLGDRIEALAATIAAVYSNIPVAHIHGGDSAKAGLDENTRHAITKLANIHFAATKKSADRIIKLGEDRWRVFVVGAPGLDKIINERLLSKRELAEKYHLDFTKPVLLVVQHSVTTQISEVENQIRQTLEAVTELNYQTIIVYPNSDVGGRKIINIIRKYVSINKNLHPFPNIPRTDYLSLLKHSSVLIGNSSSGVIETPLFHLPVIDIGIRQEGREQSTNIIHTDHKKEDIVKAINKSLFDEDLKKKVKRSKNPYGKGSASLEIVNKLITLPINERLMQKKITY